MGYVLQRFTLGTLNNMGTGMVPLILSGALIVLGLCTAVGAMLRTAIAAPEESRVRLVQLVRPTVFVLAGIALFAILVRVVGVVPAVIVMTFVGRLGSEGFGFVETTLLALALAGLAAGVFVLGLGVPLRLFPW